MLCMATRRLGCGLRHGQNNCELGWLPERLRCVLACAYVVQPRKLLSGLTLAHIPDFGGQSDNIAPAFACSKIAALAGLQIGGAGRARTALQPRAHILSARNSSAGQKLGQHLRQAWGKGSFDLLEDAGHLPPRSWGAVSAV